VRRSAGFVLVAGIVASTACGLLESRDLGEKAVDRFHQLFNEASYSVIYQEADPRFHRSTTVPDFDQLLTDVRRDLGTFKQARRTSFRSDGAPDGEITTLLYETDFTEGRAAEEFRYVVRDGKAYLVSYEIRSPRLRVR
jgi:hypothetical protein